MIPCVKDKCLKLLKDHAGNPTEHQKQLAIFVADEMANDYKPKVFRDQEPEVMRDYKALADAKARMAWDKEFPEWRLRDDVSSYLDKKQWVQQDNLSNKAFLEGCMDALEGTDSLLQKQKLSDMVAHYEPAKEPVATLNWDN